MIWGHLNSDKKQNTDIGLRWCTLFSTWMVQSVFTKGRFTPFGYTYLYQRKTCESGNAESGTPGKSGIAWCGSCRYPRILLLSTDARIKEVACILVFEQEMSSLEYLLH